MKKPSNGMREEIRKFIEFARQRDARPQLKPINYTFEPARRPDLLMPERPRTDINAADLALREIKDYASKARELYREQRRSHRPLEAREYVRHQLALGMLDQPLRRSARPEMLSRESEIKAEAQKIAKPARVRGFGFWRRRTASEN